MKFYSYIRENILVPRNLEGRKEMLKQNNIKLLSQEIIEGNIVIDKTFEGIPAELVKVKEIKGDVRISIFLNKIPVWLKDVKIYGYFDCSGCNLTSLEHCPQYIDDDFDCVNNNLISLEGCPKFIGGDLICHDNSKKLKLPEGVELKGKLFN